MDTIGIGLRIKELRGCLNLNQQEFAEKINISQSTLSLLEKGKSTSVGHLWAAIAYIFNVDLDWILKGEGQPFLSKKYPGVPFYVGPHSIEPLTYVSLPDFIDMDISSCKAYQYPLSHKLRSPFVVYVLPGDLLIIKPVKANKLDIDTYLCGYFKNDGQLRVGKVTYENIIIMNEEVPDEYKQEIELDKNMKNIKDDNKFGLSIRKTYSGKIDIEQTDFQIVGQIIYIIRTSRVF